MSSSTQCEVQVQACRIVETQMAYLQGTQPDLGVGTQKGGIMGCWKGGGIQGG